MKQVSNFLCADAFVSVVRKNCNRVAICSLLLLVGCDQKSVDENVRGKQISAPNESQPFATVKLPGDRTNSDHWTLQVVSRNANVYRYKIADSLSELRCHLGSGYGDPVSIDNPINVDHVHMSDGEIKLCIIGGQDQGAWQPLNSATSLSWTLDTSGPGEFNIDKATFADRMRVHVQLGLSQEPVKEYRIRFVKVENACDQYGYETFAESRYTDVDLTLLGGRYYLCVTAFDDLGNPSEARNNRSVEIEVPINLHFAFETRDDHGRQEAHYGSLENVAHNLWPTNVDAPEHGHVPSGRVGVISAGESGAVVIVPSHNRSIVGANDSKLYLALIDRQGDVQHILLDSGEASHAIGQQLSAASDQSGGLHIVHAGWRNQRAYLGYVQARGRDFSSLKAHDLPIDRDGYIQDINVEMDRGDHLHLAYIQQGNLLYRSTKLNGFHDQSVVADKKQCGDVLFADIEVSENDPYVAYLCDIQAESSGQDRCEFHIAKIVYSQGQVKVERFAFGVVDASRKCSPFNAMKPSIRLGSDGYLYGASVFYQSEGSMSGGIVVNRMNLSNGEIENLQKIEVQKAPFGFAQLELDVNNRVYLSYLANETLMFTSEATSPPWNVRRLSGQVVNQPVITLSSMIIGGQKNTYRSSGGLAE